MRPGFVVYVTTDSDTTQAVYNKNSAGQIIRGSNGNPTFYSRWGDYFSSDGRLFVTTNRGGTWGLRNAGLPYYVPIPGIVIDPADPQKAFLCASTSSGSRVFSTTSAGASWQDMTGALPDGVTPLALAVDFRANTFYIGTYAGVYSSSDGGATWLLERGHLPMVSVLQLRIDAHYGSLVAATHGRGVWRARLRDGFVAHEDRRSGRPH